MSKPYINLYIDGQEVEFKEPPKVLITYSHEDLHDPTVVKNSFSKTITIEGTPHNNRVFGDFYDLTRITGYDDVSLSGAYFNASKKVPFELFRNGERMEQGYVKLDKVKKKGNFIQYDVTLYGGLGEFLYNLQYRESGEEMRLSDLEYNATIDIAVNKETVADAWKRLANPDSGSKTYDVINFAPCYNGIPKDFGADKVALDMDTMPIAIRTDLGINLTDKEDNLLNGRWMLGELNKEYDEWQTKDLRSYLQRPVIRFKEIISACCNPENNGGYTVDLDSEFFNEENPYYENAWMTLPMVTDLMTNQTSNMQDVSFTIEGDKIYMSGIDVGTTYNVSVPFNLHLIVDDSTSPYLSSSVHIKCSGRYDTGNSKGTASAAITDYGTLYYAQLVAYTENDEPFGGSQIMIYGGTELRDATYLEGVYKFEPEFETAMVGNYSKWYKQTDGTYRFDVMNNQLTINDLPYMEGMYFKIIVKEAENIYGYDNYTDLMGVFYPESEYIFTATGITGPNDCQILVDKKRKEVGVNGKAEVRVEDKGYAISTYKSRGKYLTKKMLLNSENTPCDYLLSYLKMFNLHIWKDMYDKLIYVRMRKNYFNGDFYDLDDLVDRNRDILITPLTFENKWYNFGLKYDNNEKYHKDYLDNFGIQYGLQKVDTNYNFDNSGKDLFDKSVFKGCITARARNKYFVNMYNKAGDYRSLPSFIMDGMQTYIFDEDLDTIEDAYVSPRKSAYAISMWKERYYDNMPKPNFTNDKNEGVDGANVLLFFNGMVEMDDNNGNWMGYYLTDDIPEFENLNDGEPCWIYVGGNNGGKISLDVGALPMFGRYLINENNWVVKSWDFGTPKTLYVPDYSIDETSDIYTQYWKPYIRDRYNVDTKVVECNVLLKERVIGEWLQRFYYFDGTYWILNKVSDYDVTSNDTTKCEFIRIQDVKNYQI